MAYRYEKEQNGKEAIVFDGWEQGVAPSPHKGVANIQSANIGTQTNEVMASFNRAKQNQTSIAGATLTASAGLGTGYLATSSPLFLGQWVTLSAATITKDATSYSTLSALVVGGGGAGGGLTNTANVGAGGGGSGDVVPSSALTVAVTSYAVTIGNAGTGASSADGGSGGTSSFNTLTAIGGGGGGKNGDGGVAGASGGGGGTGATSGGGTTGINGHVGGGAVIGVGGGGGGGPGGNGSQSGSDSGGNAGGGLASSISGASVTYGGGGGGGARSGTGSGGAGGGGNGSQGANNGNGGSATPNTGGGGGGAANATGTAVRTGGDGGSGVVIISYPTTDLTATGGTITTSGGNTIHTFTSSGTFTVTRILVQITLPLTNYFVSAIDGSGNIKLSVAYDPNATATLVHSTTGTATFSTVNIAKPIAKAFEQYFNSGSVYNRYYILDNSGLVWVYDTRLESANQNWFLPSATGYSSATGIAVIGGWLLVFEAVTIACIATDQLGTSTSFSGFQMLGQSSAPHFGFTGHQGRCYYTDGRYVGSIFPDSTISTGSINTQCYASWVAGHTNAFSLYSLISGATPWCGYPVGNTNYFRIPVVFFTASGGTLPSSLTANTVFYLQTDNTFATNEVQVYSASTGGVAIADLSTGAVGTQYFNTFYPVGSANTFTLSPQRLVLPEFEVAQCMGEIGNTILVGCNGNVVYPWNQVDVTPSSIISIPEADTSTIITVNQMGYIFAGHKGNIYITDGSTASLVLKVPDYCAGVPGSPSTYIEPYYTWGDAMYMRGRVYFSILDQTSAKAGNCGGVWSFIPTQNLYIGQDTGISLRLQNQNSYGSYNGVATVLIQRQTQTNGNALYWAAWYSDVTSPTYGIDYSNNGTNLNFPAVIETDIAPVGTLIAKQNFTQIEFKTAAPLDTVDGESVSLQYRLNLTDAWTSCGTFNMETTPVSGYVVAPFAKAQWVQFRATLTPQTSSAVTNTFVRLREIRLR